jgi:hypothetical protein
MRKNLHATGIIAAGAPLNDPSSRCALVRTQRALGTRYGVTMSDWIMRNSVPGIIGNDVPGGRLSVFAG